MSKSGDILVMCHIVWPDVATVLCHVIESYDLTLQCHGMHPDDVTVLCQCHMNWRQYSTVSCCVTWWHHRTVSCRMTWCRNSTVSCNRNDLTLQRRDILVTLQYCVNVNVSVIWADDVAVLCHVVWPDDIPVLCHIVWKYRHVVRPVDITVFTCLLQTNLLYLSYILSALFYETSCVVFLPFRLCF